MKEKTQSWSAELNFYLSRDRVGLWFDRIFIAACLILATPFLYRLVVHVFSR